MHHARLFLQGSQRRRGTEGCKQPAVWPSRGSPSLPRRLTMANDGRRSGEGSRRARSLAQHRHPTLGKRGMHSACRGEQVPTSSVTSNLA